MISPSISLELSALELNVVLETLMTSQLQKEEIPDHWKRPRPAIPQRKGYRRNVRNYCSICLLGVLYKLSILLCISKIELGAVQLVQKAKQGSDTDSAFVVHEAAFGYVGTKAIPSALVDQVMDMTYIRDLYECNRK
ncbi:unnamed protein product [Angiostrongylus costaricensis]|uniref:Pentatricopeptide repeat-containing protein n=1 Tax=Angiostrongylus costaricensis TaxID=334426 RepID=A0A0R3PG10_ANGCS|nr:unnamed protein product [Angiostrongylus costaricensis]